MKRPIALTALATILLAGAAHAQHMGIDTTTDPSTDASLERNAPNLQTSHDIMIDGEMPKENALDIYAAPVLKETSEYEVTRAGEPVPPEEGAAQAEVETDAEAEAAMEAAPASEIEAEGAAAAAVEAEVEMEVEAEIKAEAAVEAENEATFGAESAADATADLEEDLEDEIVFGTEMQ